MSLCPTKNPLLPSWSQQLRLPLFGSPMFILSSKELVAEQCRAGIVGVLPALNARPAHALDGWLSYLDEQRAAWDADPDRPWPSAPYAVNLMTHPSNGRLDADLATIVRHQVPIVITSLSQPARVVEAVHAYGGVVFHDVSSLRFVHKALESGVEGIEQGMEQIKRLIENHDANPRGEHCKGMEGLVAEARAHGIEADIEDDDVRDASIIAQYQRMTHYGISGYGTACAFARRLGLDEDARVLDKCLEDTRGGDKHMTSIASGEVNPAAAEA